MNQYRRCLAAYSTRLFDAHRSIIEKLVTVKFVTVKFVTAEQTATEYTAT